MEYRAGSYRELWTDVGGVMYAVGVMVMHAGSYRELWTDSFAVCSSLGTSWEGDVILDTTTMNPSWHWTRLP